MDPAPSPTGASSPAGALSVRLVCDRAISCAFQQNSIPVVRELRLVNSGAADLRDLVVRLASEPAFALPAEWGVASVPAGGEYRLAPVDLALSPDFLARVTERHTGLLHAEVACANGAPAARHTETVALLAPNEWSGLASLPEILAAFALPNDPAVMRVLDAAAGILRAADATAALNGYQDKSRARVWRQVAAIYQALARLGLRYLGPPASFEDNGQKVRFPSDILAQRFATCLDLALLFAACCEQAGLHPLVLMHRGHAYGGCWLVERTLPEPVGDELQAVRKLVELEELSVCELTALTSDAPGTLEKAELLAAAHLQPGVEFRLVLDVKRARGARIRPLPVPGGPAVAPAVPAAPSAEAAAIGARAFAEPGGEPASPAPVQPVPRLEHWKSRLLDLSLRNRLLNFRATAGTVPLLSAAPEHVEDELAAKVELKLVPRPTIMGGADPRDAALHVRQQGADALVEHLRDELALGRLHTGLDETEHQRRLTELFRAARVALEENGANTLFAAVGVLEWRETAHSDRPLRAPLLLVPVELRRKSVLEGFFLRRIDEETRLNVTLMEMLRQHFQKEIPGLDPLPEDGRGVDVGLVFRRCREAVRDLPGWEVKSEVWLGQFSFAKFLLWKDLADRLDALLRHRVVRHLVAAPGTPFPNPPADVLPHELDDRFAPVEIFCPRSADSSQLAAVLAAAGGADFVLEGPPGTGKSQTITNIIAHCLAHGKRVLFVAEKRAALDVVHRRLQEAGLAPFCLELHSNKTGKGDVLAQFRESLDCAAVQTPAEWAQAAAELQGLRDGLNAYVRALHRRHPCGLSAHDCLDHLLPRAAEPVVRLDWPDHLAGDAPQLERARAAAQRLAQRAELVGDVAAHPLAPLGCADWSPAWAERVRALRQAAADRIAAAERSAGDLRGWLRRPAGPAARAECVALRDLAGALLAPHAVGAAFLTTPWEQLAGDLDRWTALTRERRALRGQLAGYDEARLAALDLGALQQDWQAAQGSWFLAKWVRTARIRARLRTARPDAAKPAAAALTATLAAAQRLREINRALAATAPAAAACLGALWAAGEPGPDALGRLRPWGELLQASLAALAGDDPAAGLALRRQVAACLPEGSAAGAAATVAGGRFAGFARDWDAFAAALADFSEATALARSALDAAPDHFAATAQLLARLEAGWSQLRPWCSWRKACAEAQPLGLGPLCTALAQGVAPAASAPQFFERSFRRGLLDAILGTDATLRDFFGAEHAGCIQRFCELDDRLTRLAREFVRARLAAGIPRDPAGSEGDAAGDELVLLRREIGKKTRHLPVRRLLGCLPTLLPRLKPCVLMSPLSVAQYLEPDHALFDLVVFDEASQIPVWDAIGAIARGRQLVVVGDPKQLPPTSFFNRTGEDGDGEEPAGGEDLESILDELLSQGVRHKRLRWHYRSRREGLIAFSNRQYYDNDLLTFPSPDVRSSGVRLQLVEARYDKGRSRTNRREAEALVAELVRRLRDPAAGRRSYGVVTFSLAQQQLVENLLDEQRRQSPGLETHFGDAPPVEGEPVFVKNLENVQGDERDVIFFSVCYGPDEAGRVSMNFGPLNRDGGERRLNVAITRARQEVLVFSTLRGDRIDLARTRARGVRDLRYFLEYAERGPAALPASAAGGGDDSGFARLVADRLRALGHEVRDQIGCSGHRLDLGIVDPAAPDRFLLGIESDGAGYRGAATARDRDKLRQLVLEGLGWKLHRIWATDWWHDPEAELKRLAAALESARTRTPARK